MKKLLLALAVVAAPLVPTAPARADWTKTCWGYAADVVGTSGPDSLYAVDSNDDGKIAVLGMGGNDTFTNVALDSGSIMSVYFCGGDGRDALVGYARGFNGQSGTDTHYPWGCGLSTALKSVERRGDPTSCPEHSV